MKTLSSLLIFSLMCVSALAQTLTVPGLQQPVEVIRDSNGVNHIYARNEHDLFFTQGYCAAKDRLFQFEVWRRQATGTVAEWLGPREVKRDMGARLFKFRGDLKKELNHYHPNGEQIIRAFTDGINAYVKEVLADKTKLPLEFRLLGTEPGFWTPDVVVSRHQGLLGNIGQEMETARQVAVVGTKKVKELDVFEPGDPILDIDPAINKERLFDDVTGLYDAFRKPLSFTPKDLVSSINQNINQYEQLALQDERDYETVMSSERQTIGSNNWIVSGALSKSGSPMLANDPHRALAAPSLRYMVHLNAPGWNVVGGGEPTIPGISIGHNDHGAWGLTIFAIDGEDLYVYDLNPQNQNQYKYKGQWEEMKIIRDTIKVKGAPDVFVEHRYTRHGPVTFVDEKNNIAYALRCGWMEPGGAPYLASLRMDQAKNWNEFREACTYSHLPGENMVWADRNGDIGWQTVGIAPIRKNWSGLTPVPGDGRYEWSGYLPIKSLPNVFNPKKGFWVTANENLVPEKYEHRDAVGWNWADKYRADRISEVLASRKKHTLEDMMRLQFDYLAIPARVLVPFLKNLKSSDANVEQARQRLLAWNFILEKNSPEAAVYVAWEKKISDNILPLFVPENAKSLFRSVPISRVIEWIQRARPEFGANPVAARDQFLLTSLEQAVADVTKRFGPDMNTWVYGHPNYHHALIKHPLSNAVDEATRKKLEVGPLPRGGYSSTPGVTSSTDNQTHGASFRMAVDVNDWDQAMFTNTPGQSGNPDSPFYRNLFERWANDQHFPVHFSRERIEKSAVEKMTLNPN
ncbi:MAG: penicillin acylase family protein [Bacteroidota bacterium]